MGTTAPRTSMRAKTAIRIRTRQIGSEREEEREPEGKQELQQNQYQEAKRAVSTTAIDPAKTRIAALISTMHFSGAPNQFIHCIFTFLKLLSPLLLLPLLLLLLQM